MIALGRQTGYDIKSLVDKATSNFWAASYGQIYPELRRLEDQGLIRGQSEPTGRRARTVYELTDAGRAALDSWLDAPMEIVFEVRDEGMLKLFFSDFGSPERRIALVRAIRESHEQTLARLRRIAEPNPPVNEGPRLTLEFGIGLNQWIVEWCETTERRLAADTEGE
jgi:DNA-binding PadR family transcriptional regulator